MVLYALICAVLICIRSVTALCLVHTDYSRAVAVYIETSQYSIDLVTGPRIYQLPSRLFQLESLLYDIADGQLQRLQSLQNAAARLVSGSRRSEHITLILKSLHCLPVRQRVTFKLATLVHKCLNDRAPAYLADDCYQVTRRQTR